MFQCSKPWKAKTCFVGEIIAHPDPLPSGLANKELASFFRQSKMTLEFVWKIRCYRTVRSKYSQTWFKFLRIWQLATCHIQLQSRQTTPAKEASTFYLVLLFAFSLETWNMMAWNGLVQQIGKYCSIRHMESPKFQTGIFGRMESAHSRTSPYGHLSNKDTSLIRTDHLVPGKCRTFFVKITSIIWTLYYGQRTQNLSRREEIHTNLITSLLQIFQWWQFLFNTIYILQGVKLRLIQAPMRLNFSLRRPNPEN